MSTTTTTTISVNQKKINKALEYVKDLERKLKTAKDDLKKLDPDYTEESILRKNLSKRGYLSKWRDREIGWGGTKWGLRFVVLEKGRLAIYKTHRDLSPTYVLQLKDCAVREEYTKKTKHDEYYVFSIYQRPKPNVSENQPDETEKAGNEGIDAQITPLLRFSTPTFAERNQWIFFITEACAYCDSDFAAYDSDADSLVLDQIPTASPFKIEPGKLPPLAYGRGNMTMALPPDKKPKLYRHKSFATNITRLKSTYPPSRPMHQSAAVSLLSDEAQRPNFRGLLNLAFILFCLSHFRILLETIKSQQRFIFYETLAFSLTVFLESPLQQFPFVSGMLLLPVFVMYAYLIEFQLSRNAISETIGLSLHHLNASFSLLSPVLIVWFFISNPVVGGILLLTATITSMKLFSYALANSDYRTSKQDSFQATLALIKDLPSEASDLRYPSNITISNIVYYWFAPTLVYQMAYPKSQKRRLSKIITLSLRMVVAMAAMLFLCAQAIAPSLDNLIKAYQDLDKGITFSFVAEYFSELALSCTYLWLIFFYTYFHLFLNIIAEVLKFGDRVFYKDWWNASEVSAYWRLWNCPVHYWLIRHVYFPCIRMHMSKNAATFVVFFVSAVIHELLISVPFHMVSYWSFFGMMGQLPLISLTKALNDKFQGSSWGNIIFWLSFCIVGQPMAILLYTVDYWGRTNNVSLYDDSIVCNVGNTTQCHSEL